MIYDAFLYQGSIYELKKSIITVDGPSGRERYTMLCLKLRNWGSVIRQRSNLSCDSIGSVKKGVALDDEIGTD